MNRRSQAEPIRTGAIRSALVLGASVFILAIIECSFLAGLDFLPAVPNIVMGAVAAVALFENERTATAFAIASGFILDAIGGSGIPISPIVMLAASVALSLLSKKMLKGFFPFILLLAASSLFAAASTALSIVLAGIDISAGYLIKSILVPEIILTILFSIPLYPIFKLLSKLCGSKGKFKI